MARKATRKRGAPTGAVAKLHSGHAKHLCELVRQRRMDEVAQRSKGAKFICHICGRAAAKAANLCEPVEI